MSLLNLFVLTVLVGGTFCIGVVPAGGAPSCVVLGSNGAEIASGEVPSAAKGTGFGHVPWDVSVSRVFAITNSGSDTLNISQWTIGGAGASAFTVADTPASVAAGSASNFTVTFDPASSGLYIASVNIENDSPTTPYAVNFSGTREPPDQMLEVSPGVLTHSIMSGQNLTNVDIIGVKNVGSGVPGEEHAMDYKAVADVSWLSINPSVGQVPYNGTNNLTVTYNSSSLTAGSAVTTYTGFITFTASNDVTGWPVLGSPQSVAVAITVNPRPTLRLNKTALTNSVLRGYDAEVQRFDVWNGSSLYPMNFKITKNVSWLMTSITSGTSTGQRHTVEVLYSTTALRVGISNALITITASNEQYGVVAVDSPQTVAVQLEIQPVAELGCDKYSLVNSIRKGGSVESQTVTVWNACAYPQSVLSYEVSSDVSWASVSPASGTNAPQTAQTITLEYDTAGLAPGTHRGTILVKGWDVGTGMEAINSPKRIALEVRVEPAKPLDFMGSDVAELVVYQEKTGCWHILNMEGHYTSTVFGAAGYIPAPGDYDGNGVSEIGVYRTLSGSWYSKPIESYTILVVGKFGGQGYVPVRGDFNGDGRQDFAVYHQTEGRWYVMSPDGTLILWGYLWGGSGYTPMARDFTGDGKADLTVYEEATGKWYIMSVADGPYGTMILWDYAWGDAGFTPLAADYDGDGLADLVAYYDGWWFITSLTKGQIAYALAWGGPGFIPVTGDYDGDGIADLAVYHYQGTWFIITLTGDVIVWNFKWGDEDCVPIGM